MTLVSPRFTMFYTEGNKVSDDSAATFNMSINIVKQHPQKCFKHKMFRLNEVTDTQPCRRMFKTSLTGVSSSARNKAFRDFETPQMFHNSGFDKHIIGFGPEWKDQKWLII